MRLLPALLFAALARAQECMYEGAYIGHCQNGAECLVDGVGSGGNSDARCKVGSGLNCSCSCVQVPPDNTVDMQYFGPFCDWCERNCPPECAAAKQCAETFQNAGCDMNTLPPCDLDKIPHECRWHFFVVCTPAPPPPPPTPPSATPSAAPTAAPLSTAPSRAPSGHPSRAPSRAPTTRAPTTTPTAAPSRSPSATPSVSPTQHPCSGNTHGCDATSPGGGACFEKGSGWECGCLPAYHCTANCNSPQQPHECTLRTATPSASPSARPSRSPSAAPSAAPSATPSRAPTAPPLSPSAAPSTPPAVEPTRSPLVSPTAPPLGVDIRGCEPPRSPAGYVGAQCAVSNHSEAGRSCSGQGRLCTAAEALQQSGQSCGGGSVWTATLCDKSSNTGGYTAVRHTSSGPELYCADSGTRLDGGMCCSGDPGHGGMAGWLPLGAGRCVDAAMRPYSPLDTVAAMDLTGCQKECSARPTCRAVEWSATGPTPCRLLKRGTEAWFESAFWLLGSTTEGAAPGTECYAPSEPWGRDRPVGCFAEMPSGNPTRRYCGSVNSCGCDPWFPFVGYIGGVATEAVCLSSLPGGHIQDCFGEWKVKVYHSSSYGSLCSGMQYFGAVAPPTASPKAGSGADTLSPVSPLPAGCGAYGTSTKTCGDAWPAVPNMSSCRDANWTCPYSVAGKFEPAAKYCKSAGGRLCTPSELVAGGFLTRPCSQGEQQTVWTGVPCNDPGEGTTGYTAVVTSAAASLRCLPADTASGLAACCADEPTAGFQYVGPGRCGNGSWMQYTEAPTAASDMASCQRSCVGRSDCRGVTWRVSGEGEPCALQLGEGEVLAALPWLTAEGGASVGCYARSAPSSSSGTAACYSSAGAVLGPSANCTSLSKCAEECGPSSPFIATVEGVPDRWWCMPSIPADTVQCSSETVKATLHHSGAYPWACLGLAGFSPPLTDGNPPAEDDGSAIPLWVYAAGGGTALAGALAGWLSRKRKAGFSGGGAGYPGQDYNELGAVAYKPSPRSPAPAL